MTTFILSEEASKDDQPGRVILDWQAHGRIIGSVEADAVTELVRNANGEMVEKIIQSAWRVAREKIDEKKFYHVKNVGWFEIAQEKPKLEAA